MDNFKDICDVLYVIGSRGRGLEYGELIAIRNSILSEKVEVLRDSSSNALGYVCYGRVRSDTVRLILKGVLPRFPDELREGYITYISHIAFSKNSGNRGIRCLLKFIRERKSLVFLHKGCAKVVARHKGIFRTVNCTYVL